MDYTENSYALYQQGREAMDRDALEEAVSLFAQSVRLSPHFKTLELQGECLMRLGRWPEAVVALAAATTLNAGVRAPSLLAEALLKVEDYHQALHVAELALSRNANNRAARTAKEEAEHHLSARLAGVPKQKKFVFVMLEPNTPALILAPREVLADAPMRAVQGKRGARTYGTWRKMW